MPPFHVQTQKSGRQNAIKTVTLTHYTHQVKQVLSYFQARMTDPLRKKLKAVDEEIQQLHITVEDPSASTHYKEKKDQDPIASLVIPNKLGQESLPAERPWS